MWFAAAPVTRWLAVRARGLECTINLWFRWLFAPGGLFYNWLNFLLSPALE